MKIEDIGTKFATAEDYFTAVVKKYDHVGEYSLTGSDETGYYFLYKDGRHADDDPENPLPDWFVNLPSDHAIAEIDDYEGGFGFEPCLIETDKGRFYEI